MEIDFNVIYKFINHPYFTYSVLVLGIVAIILLVKSYLEKKEKEKEAANREIENEAYLQGVTYLLSKETDKAIEEFIKAVKINSETLATYFALGILFRNKGEYSKAIRIHQSIIARPNIDKDVKSRAIYNLGCDYKKAGMVQKGIEIFESISKNEKYKIDALYKLQSLYEDLKDFDNAIRIVKEIKKLEYTPQKHILAHLYTEKAKMLLSDGDSVHAKKIFKKAMILHTNCIDAYLHLGDLYFNEKDYIKAIHTWKQIFDINSHFTHLAYPRLQEAYYNLNKYDAIEKLLKDQIERNERDAYCHLALGRYYFNKGNIDEALVQLNEALNIDPKFIDAKKEIASIYIQKNMVDEIKSELASLLGTLPSIYQNYQCMQCGYLSSEILWKCPQCRSWDTILPENIERRKIKR